MLMIGLWLMAVNARVRKPYLGLSWLFSLGSVTSFASMFLTKVINLA